MKRRPLWPWERPGRQKFVVETDREYVTAEEAAHVRHLVMEWAAGVSPVLVTANGWRVREVLS